LSERLSILAPDATRIGGFFSSDQQQERIAMNDAVQKYRDNVDMTIVVSTITAAIVIGLGAYGLRKAGFRTAANIVK